MAVHEVSSRILLRMLAVTSSNHLLRWFEEVMASIRRLIHSGYMAKQREATGLDNRGKWVCLTKISPLSRTPPSRSGFVSESRVFCTDLNLNEPKIGCLILNVPSVAVLNLYVSN